MRDFIANLPPTAESAVYRKQYPNSWWWTPDFDFLAAILNALQWGNWQRSGGRGDKPKVVKRPKEKPKHSPTSITELEAMKNKVRQQREGR